MNRRQLLRGAVAGLVAPPVVGAMPAKAVPTGPLLSQSDNVWHLPPNKSGQFFSIDDWALQESQRIKSEIARQVLDNLDLTTDHP